MIRAFIIDDEELALDRLERLLLGSEMVEVIGRFSDPLDFYDLVCQNSIAADICFVDISMPGMNGLELALSLQEILPNMKVCFTTSYSEYAVQAFELNALDYLMKPIVNERLIKTLQKMAPQTIEKPLGKYGIRCFGAFSILHEDQPIGNIKWRTSKAEELLALLIHQMGHAISRERIMEILWPEMDSQKAGTNLNATTYYIRKTLQPYTIESCLHVTKTIMQFSDPSLEVDVWRYEKLLNDKETLLTVKPEVALKKVSLYKGSYFGDKDYLWAYEKKAYFEMGYLKLVKYLSEHWYAEGYCEQVIALCLQVLEAVPFNEFAYEMMIKTYLKLKDTTRAKEVYDLYEKVLETEYDLEMPMTLQVLMKRRD